MFFRYGDAPSYSQTRQLYSLTANQIGGQTFSLGANGQLSANINNEFRLGFANNNSSGRPAPGSSTPMCSTDLNSALGIPASYSSVNAKHTFTSSGWAIARAIPTQPRAPYTSGTSAIPFIWTPVNIFLNSVSMSGGLPPPSVRRSCQYRQISSTRTRSQTTPYQPSWSRTESGKPDSQSVLLIRPGRMEDL